MFGRLFGPTTLSALGGGGNVWPVTRQSPVATAKLEIDADAARPVGALSDDHGRLEFSGWTELAAAIEQWRARIRRCPEHEERVDHDEDR